MVKKLRRNIEFREPNIENYKYVLKNLFQFSTDTMFDLRICDASKTDEKGIALKEIFYLFLPHVLIKK